MSSHTCNRRCHEALCCSVCGTVLRCTCCSLYIVAGNETSSSHCLLQVEPNREDYRVVLSLTAADNIRRWVSTEATLGQLLVLFERREVFINRHTFPMASSRLQTDILRKLRLQSLLQQQQKQQAGVYEDDGQPEEATPAADQQLQHGNAEEVQLLRQLLEAYQQQGVRLLEKHSKDDQWCWILCNIIWLLGAARDALGSITPRQVQLLSGSTQQLAARPGAITCLSQVQRALQGMADGRVEVPTWRLVVLLQQAEYITRERPSGSAQQQLQHISYSMAAVRQLWLTARKADADVGGEVVGHWRDEQLLQLLADQAADRLLLTVPAVAAACVVKCLLACAQLGVLPRGLLDRLAEQQQRLLPVMDEQQVGNAAHALAMLGTTQQGPQLLEALWLKAVQLQQQPQTLQQQQRQRHLLKVLWATALLDERLQGRQVQEFVKNAFAAGPLWDTLEGYDLGVMYQVHLWLRDQKLGDGQGLAGSLKEQQLEQCRQRWKQQLQRLQQLQPAVSGSRGSWTQRQVAAAVRRLPSTVVEPGTVLEEEIVEDDACLTDIVCTSACGRQLVIEVDGPQHYRYPDQAPTGSTMYRNRCVKPHTKTFDTTPYKKIV